MDSTMGFNEVHYGDEIVFNSDNTLMYDEDFGMEYVCGYINDNSLLRYEEQILNSYSSTDRFYNHIVLCSSHVPFHCPKVLDEAFLNNDTKLKKEIGSYFYNYISLAHYVDYCIGRFIDDLDEAGILDNTSIVVMGDHGGIHKYMSNRTKRSIEGKKKYKWTTSGADYSVLTVLYNKNINGHYVIGKNGNDYNFNMDIYNPTDYNDNICGQIDVLPTLAYMLNIEDYFYYDKDSYRIRTLMGRNMLKSSLSYAIKASFNVVGEIDSDYKILKKGKYLSNQIIKSQYFGKKEA
jgi:phosphoglycerol transferase MdoB-like AlkP superfamily enzyme